MTRVVVAGAGSIGSLLAGHLAQVAEVTVLTRREEHATALRENGLRVSGRGDFTAQLAATADPFRLPEDTELAILACKGTDLEPLAATLEGRLPSATVMTIQNGLGAEEVVAAHVDRVIRGTTFPAGKIIEPGHVQWDVKGDTTIGPFEERPAPFADVQRLADACTRAGMPTHAVEDARGPQWRKVIFNASTNPIGALTGLTHGRVCERPDLRALVSGLVNEGKAVAAAQGIELDSDPEALIDHAAKPEVAYGHKASMLQDVEARRTTEIDYLNGGIVRFGLEHDVPTPLNEAIWALVKGVEDSWH